MQKPAQKIKSEIVIELPADQAIYSKGYVEELEQFRNHESLDGVWWTMDELMVRLHKGRKWIKDNILNKYYRVLSYENGGPVFYPTEGTSEQWAFNAKPMANFLTKNFPDIYRNKE